MLEKYYKYRIKYKDCLLFFKYGNFYELFDKDAYIINNMFNYKISIISDNIKCGFPVNKLDNILIVLNDKHINYYIIDKDINISPAPAAPWAPSGGTKRRTPDWGVRRTEAASVMP